MWELSLGWRVVEDANNGWDGTVFISVSPGSNRLEDVSPTGISHGRDTSFSSWDTLA